MIYEYITRQWYTYSNPKTPFNYEIFEIYSLGYPHSDYVFNTNSKLYYYYVNSIDSLQTLIENDLLPQYEHKIICYTNPKKVITPYINNYITNTKQPQQQQQPQQQSSNNNNGDNNSNSPNTPSPVQSPPPTTTAASAAAAAVNNRSFDEKTAVASSTTNTNGNTSTADNNNNNSLNGNLDSNNPDFLLLLVCQITTEVYLTPPSNCDLQALSAICTSNQKAVKTSSEKGNELFMCLPKSHNIIPRYILVISNKLSSPEKTDYNVRVDELYHQSVDTLLSSLKETENQFDDIDYQYRDQARLKLNLYEQKVYNEIDPETCMKLEETENKIIQLQKEALELKKKIDQEKALQDKILKTRK